MSGAALVEAHGLVPAGRPGAALDLAVAPGEVVCLIGLHRQDLIAQLRALGGVDPPAAGRVLLLGRDPARLSPEQWYELRRDVGYVTAGAPLLSVLSGQANLMLPALYHRLGTRPEVEARVARVLADLPLERPQECLQRLPAYMNRLERRLLAIARALVLEPRVLFLEEPLRDLELPEQETLAAYLGLLAAGHGLALVLATKNLHFVRHQADRLVFVGPERVAAFTNWPAFVASSEPGIVELLRQERIVREGLP